MPNYLRHLPTVWHTIRIITLILSEFSSWSRSLVVLTQSNRKSIIYQPTRSQDLIFLATFITLGLLHQMSQNISHKICTGGSDANILNQNYLYAYFWNFPLEKTTCIFPGKKLKTFFFFFFFFLKTDFSEAKFPYSYIFFTRCRNHLYIMIFNLYISKNLKKGLYIMIFLLVYF